MSAPELESDHYDSIVIGTGLAESIAAASLAKAGKSILHLDPNEYYGGQQASLTLDELAIWAEAQVEGQASTPSSTKQAYGVIYSQASTSKLTPQLEKDKRRYAISLFPAVLPSRGKLIETLIASDVSKYVSFRLLDSVSIYEPSPTAEAEGGFKKVPGSKEEVFKDKSVKLLDKRRLMKFLMFAAGEFEQDELLRGKETQPLLDFLQESFSIPVPLSQSIAYAISHCSSEKDEILPSLIRTRRYLRSIGRYGPSAFLVGQYGGAGEVAQGFCRACAVFGGTYVLGPSAIPTSIEQTADGISLQIPCHPRPVTASHLISLPNHLPPNLASSAAGGAEPAVQPEQAPTDAESSTSTTAHCIAISSTTPEALRRSSAKVPEEESGAALEAVDGSGEADAGEVEREENDDTSVTIFPPVDGSPLVRCYINGEGTGSCPSGQYIIYLSATIASDPNGVHQDPADILRPYLSKITSQPTYEAYYLSHRPSSQSAVSPPSTSAARPEKIVVLNPYGGDNLLTEGLDYEAEQGETAFYKVIGEVGENGDGKKFFEKEITEEGEMGLDE
ncbi:hypothetical protein IAT40_001919 [Kwoniella sp. CBS 6097]